MSDLIETGIEEEVMVVTCGRCNRTFMVQIQEDWNHYDEHQMVHRRFVSGCRVCGWMPADEWF